MHPLLTLSALLLQEGAPAPATSAPQTSATTAEPGGPAAPATPSRGPFDNFLVPMLLVAAVFWFVMIGPERKQRKKREQMLSALSKGDKVLMQGGIYGTIAQVQEDVLSVQVADGVRVRFARSAVQAKLEEEPAAKDGAKEPAKKDSKA